MSELDLSPEALRRLWQCYSLLLRLADEAETEAVTDSELCEDDKLATASNANELTRLDSDNPTDVPEQIEEQLVVPVVIS